MTILFCKAAWLIHYCGEIEPDYATDDNEKFLYHFQDYNGYCYGRMNEILQIPEESREGVTIVWIAQDEFQEEPVIIGWYKDATIFREEQWEPDKYAIGRELRYHARTKSIDAVLLPEDQRNFVVTEQMRSHPESIQLIAHYLENYHGEKANRCYTEQVISYCLKDCGLNHEELMEAGDRAIEEEDFYRALLYFNTAFRLKKNIDAIFNIAAMLESLYCFDQAIKVFEKLRELEGNEPDTLDNLLNLYLQTKNYQKALEICDLAQEQAEDQEEVCGLLCVRTDIYTNLGEKEKAIACLEFVLQHSEDDFMKEQAEQCKHHLQGCHCHHHHDREE